jgi:acetyltransferase-like isoleucine patch superfamily enzyme
MNTSPDIFNISLLRALAVKLTTNARTDRLLFTLLMRRAANWLRTTLYFWMRCRYARRSGLVRIPWNVSIYAPNKIVELGDCVQFGPRCVVQCDIRFGNHVLIAGNVAFVGRSDHRFDVVGMTTWESPRGAAEVTIVEDDVWIGYGAIVLSGRTIGRGSVIAAGAVVTSDVERYSIVAGVPAREMAKRFSKEEIQQHEELLAFR